MAKRGSSYIEEIHAGEDESVDDGEDDVCLVADSVESYWCDPEIPS